MSLKRDDNQLKIFSDSYTEARQKFVSAAPAAKQFGCTAIGASGEPLFTDAAYFGELDAPNLLVLISATHGVEGYCGSAAQLAFLQDNLHCNLNSSTAVLIVHALNSYGFSWDRRVTHEGCDLNRNFIDFSQDPPSNLGYAELAEAIVPVGLSNAQISTAQEQINHYKQIHGDEAFQSAFSSGQYTHPKGMFYGGTKPTEARLILDQIMDSLNGAPREKVVVIDYHTGLGPYGYGELQCEQASGVDGYERARAIFGQSVTSPALGTSSASVLHGTQAEYWERTYGDRHVYVCLEYGTFDANLVRGALTSDHWLYAHSPQEVNSDLGKKIRIATKNAFYPQYDDWKQMVISRARTVHLQALAALSG
jgi:hypothetical protein